MSLEYAENRIKEALKLCNGNRIKARQMIIAMAMEDQKLLQALTKAHLSGIVAYNIERVSSGRADKARAKNTKAAPQKPQAQRASTSGNTEKEESFGLQMLKAAGASDSTFGFEDAGRGGGRGVSQTHINAIRAIAQKQKDKS